MKFLNDEYTLDINALGYKKQVDTVRDLILKAETPFSIGISGRWGSGKTSVMKYLMASLGGKPLQHRLEYQTKIIKEQKDFIYIYNDYKEQKDCEFIQTIWFNPWEHENSEEPFVELLKEIKNHFTMLLTTEKSKKIISTSIQAGLDMLGSYLKLGKNQATNAKNIGEKYEYENFEYTTRNQRFKLIFQDTIEKLLATKKVKNEYLAEDKARLIIFIDDLDRCEDDTIAKLLKEIKQYLTTKRCIFVFGYDRHHIEKSLSKTETKTNKETRAYLEKLFQTTFYIKEPKEDYLKSFVKNIINNFNIINVSFFDDLTNFIISIIDSNPRRLKSFLTTLYFHIKSSELSDSSYIDIKDLQKLTLIAYLKLFYESVYTALENQPKLLNDLVNAINGKKFFDNVIDEKEYYFKLEFKNHLNILGENLEDMILDSDSQIDEEEKNFKDKIEYSTEFEEKFLNEIYEMQGKHKSFANFSNKFVNHFQNIEIEELENYL